MYRLLLVACLLLVTAVSAQRPMARVILKDGTTMTGAILRQSEDTIVLRVGNRPQVVRVEDIEDLEAVTPHGGGSRAQDPDQAGKRESGRLPATPAVEQERYRKGRQAGGNAAVDHILDLSRVAMQFIERYLWAMPRSTGARISLGFGIWLVLGLIVHFSSVLNGVRDTSMMRALFMGLVVSIAAMLQTLLPFQGLQWLAVLGMDLVLWLLATQLLYQAGLMRGLLMLLTTIGLALLAVVCVMLARYLVQVVQSRAL